MGRPKGFVVSDETKAKMRAAKREKKIFYKPLAMEKVELIVSGKEETGFDFWKSLRETLRPIHKYMLCKKIEREIVASDVWRDVGAIKNILTKYFDVRVTA